MTGLVTTIQLSANIRRRLNQADAQPLVNGACSAYATYIDNNGVTQDLYMPVTKNTMAGPQTACVNHARINMQRGKPSPDGYSDPR